MLTKEKLKYKMSRIQSKNTKPERFVRSYLHKKGYRFKLHDRSILGKPDLVLKKYKTIILVNGCFWHQHPRCKWSKIPKSKIVFWRKKLSDNVSRQKAIIKILRSNGFYVFVLWECQIYRNLDKLMTSVENRLKKIHRKV